ncbi:hypothetical protein SESBI_50558 [Sesbania bispinosa]|nr:hypothetical protein SESBI_50558 [Sesbania bispinosa]
MKPEGKRFDKLFSSAFTLLKTVEYDVEVCGISIVPERLKESNEDAYMPRVVSIGPRYRGTREDLLLGCMLSLIHRAGELGDAVEYLKKCTKAIQRLDQEVRQNYVFFVAMLKKPSGATSLLGSISEGTGRVLAMLKQLAPNSLRLR